MRAADFRDVTRRVRDYDYTLLPERTRRQKLLKDARQCSKYQPHAPGLLQCP